jgi:outer membrane protein assembly factor BamD
MLRSKIIFLVILVFFTGCSKDEKEISPIKQSKQEQEMIQNYEEAYSALEKNDTFYAAKKFLEAELLYPQSVWAPNAVLMASYSYYLQNYYSEALDNLERYLLTYPNHENQVYAHYLIAICYYEVIDDEKKDTEPILKAEEKFKYIIDNFPNSDFSLDSKFKLNLLQDILASKEMYIGRHYIKKKKWVAALNRFKNVVENYDETIFIEEALHRLVEIYYLLGLSDMSQKYANILGYNYLSSEWYKKSYRVFNKEYSTPEINKFKNKGGVIDRFKKLFD